MSLSHNPQFVQATLEPPRDADPTGEWVAWGGERKQVFRMRRPLEEVTEIVPHVINGQVQMHLVAGQPVKEKTVRVPIEGAQTHFEFILVNVGNGNVRMERNFRPTEAETEQLELARLNEPSFLAARLAALEAGSASRLLEIEERFRAELAERDERIDRAARLMKDGLGLSAEDVEELLGTEQLELPSEAAA